jgi:hypothetical protein
MSFNRGELIIPGASFVAEICGCPWLRDWLLGQRQLSIDVDVSTMHPLMNDQLRGDRTRDAWI